VPLALQARAGERERDVGARDGRAARAAVGLEDCLRSPVEAGSMPYSAVTQPRPFPAIQRGTASCADAVQITRVSPIVINADPVAVRTNPGSIAVGRSSPALRP
jgi:hypothetical protein